MSGRVPGAGRLWAGSADHAAHRRGGGGPRLFRCHRPPRLGRAYGLLHPESRARWNADRFARAAEAYRRGLGFEPEAVRVRSCGEQGDEAKAHLVIEGQTGGKQKLFKEAAELRRSASGWGVVLPRRFGR